MAVGAAGAPATRPESLDVGLGLVGSSGSPPGCRRRSTTRRRRRRRHRGAGGGASVSAAGVWHAATASAIGPGQRWRRPASTDRSGSRAWLSLRRDESRARSGRAGASARSLSCAGARLVGRLDQREDDLVGGHEDRAEVLDRRALGRHRPRRRSRLGRPRGGRGLVDARPVALDEERRRRVGVGGGRSIAVTRTAARRRRRKGRLPRSVRVLRSPPPRLRPPRRRSARRARPASGCRACS